MAGLLIGAGAFVAHPVLTVVAATASVDTESTQPVPEIQDSAALAGPALLHGSVRQAGLGVPATVIAYAWPSEETMAGMAVGAQFKLVPIARATAGPDGTYTLRADSTALTEYFRGRADNGPTGERLVDVSIVTAHGPERSAPATSLRIDPETRAARPGGDPRSAPDGGADPSGVELDIDVGSDGQFGGPRAAVGGTGATAAAFSKSCSSSLVRTHSPSRTLVFEIHNDAGRTDAVVRQSGSSELGAAISTSAGATSFRTNGTLTRSYGTEVGYPTRAAGFHGYLDTSWEYGEFYVQCVDPQNGSVSYWTEVRPNRWAGGTPMRSGIPIPTFNYCSVYSAGSYLRRETSRAVTWTNGVEISGVVGFDLSARTGYATSEQVTYWMDITAQACGNDNYATAAHRIAVYPK